jgi:hypothetical protein
MVLQEGESYDQIFADIERVIMPGVSCIITLHFDGKFIKSMNLNVLLWSASMSNYTVLFLCSFLLIGYI